MSDIKPHAMLISYDDLAELERIGDGCEGKALAFDVLMAAYRFAERREKPKTENWSPEAKEAYRAICKRHTKNERAYIRRVEWRKARKAAEQQEKD